LATFNASKTFRVIVNEVNMPPTLHIASQAGSTLTLSWSVTIGRTYQVQYKTNLNQLNWSNLGGLIIATNTVAAASNAMGPDLNRFYRVILMP
jgi:hypothetical protein